MINPPKIEWLFTTSVVENIVAWNFENARTFLENKCEILPKLTVCPN
jgi:hypothetical protein